MATPVATGGIADGPKSLTEAITLEHGPSLGSRVSCRQAYGSDHLRHAAATYYGTAGRAFLQLVRHARMPTPSAACEGITAAVHRDHLPAGSDGQVRSVRPVRRRGGGRRTGDRMGHPALGNRRSYQAAAICFRAWLTSAAAWCGSPAAIGRCGRSSSNTELRAFPKYRTNSGPSIAVAGATRWRRLGVSRPAGSVEIRGLSRDRWRGGGKGTGGSEFAEARREEPDLQGDDTRERTAARLCG